MKIDDKFKEVKDFQQFRAKAKAGARVGVGAARKWSGSATLHSIDYLH